MNKQNQSNVNTNNEELLNDASLETRIKKLKDNVDLTRKLTEAEKEKLLLNEPLIDTKLSDFEELIKLQKMDSIDRSYHPFKYEGGLSNEKKELNLESVSNHPMVLNEEKIQKFKDTFKSEKIWESITNSKNSPLIQYLENQLKLKISIDNENEPLMKIDDGILKINLNRVDESVRRSLEYLSSIQITEQQIKISGEIIPTFGSYLFYSKVSKLFDQHLKADLQYSLKTDRLAHLRMNKQMLLIFNICTLLGTSVLYSGLHVVKNTGIAHVKVLLNTGENSNLNQSLIPLFILNKLSKIPKWVKFIILFISMRLCLNYIENNYPSLFSDINYNYVLFGFSLFLMYILFFILKLITVHYLLIHRENLTQIKPYKYLPKNLKDFITELRESEPETLNKFISHYLFLLKINLVLLIIGISSLIYLKYVLI